MDLYNSWLILLLLAEVGFCSGQPLAVPPKLSGVRGKSVNFTATGSALNDFQVLSWGFTSLSGSVVPVYAADPRGGKVADTYKGRVNFYSSTNTLELSSLTAADSGTYTLSIIINLEQQITQTALQVLEPVADVSIAVNPLEAVEINSTVILTCNAKGSSLVYSWLNNSAPVVADGKHIVQNGSQLIIKEVFRTDLQGPIYCTAKNELESSTSTGINVTVNYGPELVTKTQEPLRDAFEKGSNLTLSCSAKSSPAAQFIWLFNDAQLPQKTATVVLLNLGVEQSGNYSCMAYNSKTQRFVSSEVTKLSVIEALSGTNIIAPSLTLIAGNSTVNLTCTSTVGKADSVNWLKDGKALEMTSRIIFTTDKSSVTILPVQKEDAGQYECQLKNKISMETKKYNMTVNYGPENVAITGDKRAVVGQFVQINCSVASFPAPTFVWKFNSTVLPGKTNPCIQIPNFENQHSGIYTCEAFNNVTGLRKTATHYLMVKADGEELDQEGLSSGAIAGIVIAVLLVLAIIIGVCISKKRKDSDVPSPY